MSRLHLLEVSSPAIARFALATATLTRFAPRKAPFRTVVDLRWKSAFPTPEYAGGQRIENCSALPAPDADGQEIRDETQFPTAVRRVAPSYPPYALEKHVAGDVCVGIVVAPDGSVSSATIVSRPSALDGAAKAAVERWRFLPLVSNGKPIAWKSVIDLRFRAW